MAVSEGHFHRRLREAKLLAALLGSSAPGDAFGLHDHPAERGLGGVEAERWQRRDLTAKRYVYFWVDGI